MTHTEHTIGQVIRQLRKGSGMTQGELGTKIGRTDVSICQIETGIVSIKLHDLLLISSVFGADIHELIDILK